MLCRTFSMFGLLISSLLAFGAGCVPGQDDDNDDAQTVGSAEQEINVAQGTIQISVGRCTGNGIVIKDGAISTVGSLIRPDVTGISSLNRVPNGPVCHNQNVWMQAALYMCHTNLGGTHNAAEPAFNEWVGGVLYSHPANGGEGGMFFGHMVLRGPCDTPSQLDYALDHIECCATAPTPILPTP